MKTIILSVFVLGFASCQKKWNKENLLSRCNKEFKKENAAKRIFTDAQLSKLCECVAEKMVTRYRSEAEAKSDRGGEEAIGSECAREIMQ